MACQFEYNGEWYSEEELKAIFNNPQKDSSIINASLKATNALFSDRADDFFKTVEKNKLSGETFWKKMQSDLSIPKEQIDILKSFGTQKRDELITNLLANYSYTIEINTAKKQEISNKKTDGFVLNNRYYRHGFDSNGVQSYEVANILDTDNFQMWEPDTFDEHIEISKEEYLKARKETGENTSHYANLTVPGGTNYTENEIATPNITPSIKGHAQFATPNGIGWFRSDESQQYQETDVQSIIDNLQKSGQLEINCK